MLKEHLALRRPQSRWTRRDFAVYYLPKQYRHDTEARRGPRTESWSRGLFKYENGHPYVLNRTASGWFRLFIFYLIFYLCLISMWLVSLLIFEHNLSTEEPRVAFKQPGFSVFPSPRSQLIEFQDNVVEDIEPYVDEITTGLSKYGFAQGNIYDPCKESIEYGYRDGNPCVFLKVNRAVGFKAETYNDPNTLPTAAPWLLRAHVNSLPPEERKDRVWITCKPSVNLEVKMYPKPYVAAGSIYAGPRTASKDERSLYDASDYNRIVAMQISNVPRNVKVSITCMLWAKNIERDENGYMGHGLLRIHLLIKEK